MSKHSPLNSIAFQNHDHSICIDQALALAEQRCHQLHARLTPQRKRVLELIWQSHKPLGAYDLLEMLNQASQKRIAPATIYRALDFLQATGLVHRLASLNAFTGCCAHDSHADCCFFICEQCRRVIEMEGNEVASIIDKSARQANFSYQQLSLEVVGLCPDCRTDQ